MMDQNRHSEADSGSLPPHFLSPKLLPSWFPFSTYPSPYAWYRRIQPQFHCPAPPLLQYNRTSISSGFQKPSQSGLKLPNFLSNFLSHLCPSLSTLLLSLRLRLTGTSFSSLGLSTFYIQPLVSPTKPFLSSCVLRSLTAEFLLLLSHSVVSDSVRPHRLQPTGSSIHGIFQARVLEWGAIAISVNSYYCSLTPASSHPLTCAPAWELAT